MPEYSILLYKETNFHKHCSIDEFRTVNWGIGNVTINQFNYSDNNFGLSIDAARKIFAVMTFTKSYRNPRREFVNDVNSVTSILAQIYNNPELVDIPAARDFLMLDRTVTDRTIKWSSYVDIIYITTLRDFEHREAKITFLDKYKQTGTSRVRDNVTVLSEEEWNASEGAMFFYNTGEKLFLYDIVKVRGYEGKIWSIRYQNGNKFELNEVGGPNFLQRVELQSLVFLRREDEEENRRQSSGTVGGSWKFVIDFTQLMFTGNISDINKYPLQKFGGPRGDNTSRRASRKVQYDGNKITEIILMKRVFTGPAWTSALNMLAMHIRNLLQANDTTNYDMLRNWVSDIDDSLLTRDRVQIKIVYDSVYGEKLGYIRLYDEMSDVTVDERIKIMSREEYERPPTPQAAPPPPAPSTTTLRRTDTLSDEAQRNQLTRNNPEYVIQVVYKDVKYHQHLRRRDWTSLLSRLLPTPYGDVHKVAKIDKTDTNPNTKITLKELYGESPATRLRQIASLLVVGYNGPYVNRDGIKKGLIKSGFKREVVANMTDGDLEKYAFAIVEYDDEGAEGYIVIQDNLDTDGLGVRSMRRKANLSEFKVESSALEVEKLSLKNNLKLLKKKEKLLAKKQRENLGKIKRALDWQKKISLLTLEEYNELIKQTSLTHLKKCKNDLDGLLYAPWEADDYKNTIFLRFTMKGGETETWCLIKKVYPADPKIPGDKDEVVTHDKYIDNMLYSDWVENKDGTPYTVDERMGVGGGPGLEKYVRITTIFNGAARYILFDDLLKQVIKVKKGDGRERDSSEIGVRLPGNWDFPIAIYLEFYRNVAIGNIRGDVTLVSGTHGNRYEDIYKVTDIKNFQHYENVDEVSDWGKSSSSGSTSRKRKKLGLKF